MAHFNRTWHLFFGIWNLKILLDIRGWRLVKARYITLLQHKNYTYIAVFYL